MLLNFIRICIIFILIGGGIILFKQQSLRDRALSYLHINDIRFANLPEVKGIKISKAGELTKNIKSDVDAGVKQTQKGAMNLKVSDLINIYERGQKLVKDFRSFQDYVKEQVNNAVKK